MMISEEIIDNFNPYRWFVLGGIGWDKKVRLDLLLSYFFFPFMNLKSKSRSQLHHLIMHLYRIYKRKIIPQQKGF